MLYSSRIVREKKIVVTMIKFYCKKNHNTKEQLCTGCLKLKEYALKRLDACKFGNNKTICGDCKIQCYQKDMKDEIIKVMGYSGPRMIIYHPIMAIEHLIFKYKNTAR